MDKLYKKQITILPSMCDYSGRLGTADVFALFSDMASEHAEILGLGGEAMMKKGLFWVAVKTKVRIISRPYMAKSVLALTWPAAPQKRLCSRNYQLKDNDAVIAEGRSEWAVIDIEKQTLSDITKLYSSDITPDIPNVLPEPFLKISRDFEGCKFIGKYTVKSTDIDIGSHMNNAAYAYAAMSFLSVERQKQMNISEAEIHFVAQSYEGEELSVYERITDERLELGFFKADGTRVLLVSMR